jgi:DNA-binding transcriptional LysR family regulator
MDLGRTVIAPLVAEFTGLPPGLETYLVLSDSGLEVGQDGLAVALRIGLPDDANLIVRKIAMTPQLVCAAPAYLERHGLPQKPEDVQRHQCLRLVKREW